MDDVGRRRRVISDERGERTKQNAGHELEVQKSVRCYNLGEAD